MDRNEILSSMDSAAADIQRWVLQMALSGRVSADRCNDMRHNLTRLSTLVAKLEDTK